MTKCVWTGIGSVLIGIAAVVAWFHFGVERKPQQAESAQTEVVTVYKNPQCGCCAQWVSHLRERGFEVIVHDVEDTATQRAKLGVPSALGSCHTATVRDYAIEGHVPAADIRQLLRQQPDVAGIAVPGMPAGSPGMESSAPVAYQTVSFTKKGETRVFAEHVGND